MTSDPSRWDGLGVPPGMLKPDLAVMVPIGMISATVNGGPAVICYATVIGPASAEDSGVFRDPTDVWWLEVHVGPDAKLPQMYRADQILGVPALGLTMAGAPDERLTG